MRSVPYYGTSGPDIERPAVFDQRRDSTMNGHGGKRPGAGRPKGAASRANEEVRQEAAASGELPLAYMLRIMRDPSQPVGRRDDMAKAAAPPSSRSRAGRSERQRRPPYRDHRDGERQGNVFGHQIGRELGTTSRY